LTSDLRSTNFSLIFSTLVSSTLTRSGNCASCGTAYMLVRGFFAVAVAIYRLSNVISQVLAQSHVPIV
jgi:hypothetical protein